MQTTAPQAAVTPGLADYIQALKFHDWSYQYSEDMRVWRAGASQRAVLNDLRSRLDPDGAVWNQHAPSDEKYTKPIPAPTKRYPLPPGEPMRLEVHGLPFFVTALGGFVVFVKINGGWFDAMYAVGAAMLNDLQCAYEAQQPDAKVAA